MGNTVASGNGISYQVGINCDEIKNFNCNIKLTFKDFLIYKITYNNTVYGKACLAGTENVNNVILAQNKNFNFQWQIVQNQDTGDFFIYGNHTKKCQKNSLAIVEIMQITPQVLAKNNSESFLNELNIIKFKNDSYLDKKIKKIIGKND
jgi:hypothetical protein